MSFFKSLFFLALGAYAGVYATQNYDVPKIDDPKVILARIQEYLKKYEKPPPK
jgi:hypothetical protein